jgi:hypothetical protein
VISKTATQIDLAPTILDILKSSDTHTSFGRSVFDDGSGAGLLAYGDFNVFVRDGRMLVSDGTRIMETYAFTNSPDDRSGKKTAEDLKKEEGYYLQFFHDLIIHNRLTPLSKK